MTIKPGTNAINQYANPTEISLTPKKDEKFSMSTLEEVVESTQLHPEKRTALLSEVDSNES